MMNIHIAVIGNSNAPFSAGISGPVEPSAFESEYWRCGSPPGGKDG